ncbi:MAG: glycosyltransferase [Propionivibrio sp.]|uniref:glycosyltransferase n=1 Tax=Propionivibrio sp. TaxID=2212460 RepID=UPI0025CD818F|nr:glycosyltransferase [Propionivibrio sp.]MBK8894747.1 glycosyltransferase [Propionivibrio sp.]
MPQVSVILSSLNHAKYLEAAIDSVLNQTFGDFEFFIVDDASDDNSWEIIRRYKDHRIIAMKNSRRMRGAYGFNEIISKHARGEYIAIHHSDDMFLPQKLGRQVAFLDAHPEIAAVFTRADIIDEEGAPFADPDHFYASIFRQQNRTRFEWLRHFFLHGNCLCHPSVLARRSAYLSVGLYDRRLGQLTDFDLWIRMCLQQEIHILDEPLVKFRVRAGEANQSGHRAETMVRGRNEWMQVLRNYLKIENEKDLLRIFPDTRNRYPLGTPLSYQLAIHALDVGGDTQRAFGLELLFALMLDERMVATLDGYGFRYLDLIERSGQYDYFGNTDLYRVECESRALKAELRRVKNTFSWRITKPMRFCTKVVSKILRGVTQKA